MADATAKWGVRLNRIEILDITPPMNVVQAMSEQKEAEQHKRAAILKSEGEQQAAVNSAGGRKQAAVLEAEGAKQSAILRAEAQMKVLELQAEGEKKALELRGEGEASRLTSIDTATINPHTLAVLQLKALQDIASSENAKIVVPYEATSLMGAAEVLLSTLRNENLGDANDQRLHAARGHAGPAAQQGAAAAVGRVQAQPSSRSRASPRPKWWPTSWSSVTRTRSASSSGVRADRQIVARNSVIWSGTRSGVGAALGQRNPLVQPVEAARRALVVDDDGHVLHLGAQLVGDRLEAHRRRAPRTR